MDRQELGKIYHFFRIPLIFELSFSKTHTMEGNINDREEAGIVPRAVNTILEHLESSGAEFTIRVSFLELCKYP